MVHEAGLSTYSQEMFPGASHLNKYALYIMINGWKAIHNEREVENLRLPLFRAMLQRRLHA